MVGSRFVDDNTRSTCPACSTGAANVWRVWRNLARNAPAKTGCECQRRESETAEPMGTKHILPSHPDRGIAECLTNMFRPV